MRRNTGISVRCYGIFISIAVKRRDWRFLCLLLRQAFDDRMILENRDTAALKVIFREYYNGQMNDQWLATGFDQSKDVYFAPSHPSDAAELMKNVFAYQKKVVK